MAGSSVRRLDTISTGAYEINCTVPPRVDRVDAHKSLTARALRRVDGGGIVISIPKLP